ncbi:hypothetical protein [Nocardia sputorum]|uniref:PPE domain-containing protein n=1 Tax=Nocardia sputorum TaxID=2984338 RepID=A0ABM8CRT0_9NOCA|nr:hypothetical protein [Nocardia sputorum]BDT97678.1 hypothetical protein IFM12276_07070 [Nocardia sputorum]
MRQTDGRAITNPENAQSFSHAEIKQAADAMNPAGLDGAFAAWSAIAAAVTNAGQRFEDAVKKAVEQHWEGAAAESAVRGVRDYAGRVGELGEALSAQSLPLSAAANAASKFKSSVPDLVDASAGAANPEQRNSREEQARDEMNTQYIQPYGATAPAIPTLPPPVSPAATTPTGVETSTGTEVNPSAGSQPVDSGRPASGNSSADDKPAPEGTASPGEVEGEGTPDEPTQPTAENAAETTTSQAVSQSQDTAATTPASTTRTQTSPATPFVPTTAPAATPTAVVPTSFDGRPNGTRSRSGTPGAAGSPGVADNQARSGTSRPAQPTAPAAANPQSNALGRASTPVGSGYSGMVPPGLRGRRAEDEEHKSPKYLRTEEHAKELLGEVQPTVPPALGEK